MNNPAASTERGNRLSRWATYASVTVAVLLIAAKGAAYAMTGSVSLLSSLLDSSMDALASLVTLIGVAHAQRPPDRAHRFGHGKAEALAALGQAAFITVSALLLGVAAVARLIRPEPVSEGWIGVGVMVFSMMMTMGLIAFQRHVVRKTGSLAIGADRLHYTGDLLMNTAVIVALVLATTTAWPYFDPLFGLAIAIYLLFGAGGIGHGAFHILMDRELPPEDRERIVRIVGQHPATRGLHDIRTRSGGDRVFIEFHLELDPDLTLAKAHAIAHEVEDQLLESFLNAEILIHQEPAGLEDERLDMRLGRANKGVAKSKAG